MISPGFLDAVQKNIPFNLYIMGNDRKIRRKKQKRLILSNVSALLFLHGLQAAQFVGDQRGGFHDNGSHFLLMLFDAVAPELA